MKFMRMLLPALAALALSGQAIAAEKFKIGYLRVMDDAQVMAAIARLTGGNFRLLQRLFVQVDRVLQAEAAGEPVALRPVDAPRRLVDGRPDFGRGASVETTGTSED